MDGQLAVVGATWLPSWLVAIIGCLLVLGTASSVIRTLLVTRGMNSIITRALRTIPSALIGSVARRFKDYERRDKINSWLASMSIVSLLIGWLVLFLIGYSLILFGTSALNYSDALREAGSSLFTLGFASSNRSELTAVDFIAAATGPIVIGLMIGYLPTFYSSYNKREVDVALLKARAGEPNWGPEILSRAAVIGSVDRLPLLWQEWERWAADVSESHATYPILIHTRSARPFRNWVIALLAVMDSAALALALNPHQNQASPRILLRQGVECLRDLCRAAKIPHNEEPTPDTPIQLTFEEFSEAVAMLDANGYPHQRSAEAAWVYFHQWRSAYEAMAYDLAKLIDAVPAVWSGPRNPPTKPIHPRRPHYIVDNPEGSLRFSTGDTGEIPRQS